MLCGWLNGWMNGWMFGGWMQHKKSNVTEINNQPKPLDSNAFLH